MVVGAGEREEELLRRVKLVEDEQVQAADCACAEQLRLGHELERISHALTAAEMREVDVMVRAREAASAEKAAESESLRAALEEANTRHESTTAQDRWLNREVPGPV